MSGGHFDYKQYHIDEIIYSLEKDIELNKYDFSEEIIYEFKKGLEYLKKAKYIHEELIG